MKSKMSRKNPQAICEWPPKQPCLKDTKPGVRCMPIPYEDRSVYTLPQNAGYTCTPGQPVVYDWPPKEQMGQGDCASEDLLSKIPDHIVPQVVTVERVPDPCPGQTVSPIQHAKINHPVCPDAQMHMEITPPIPVKTEIRIPDLGCAVRQPLRRWRQCIENTLVNDRVRRPMARWCHKRPLPPLVIPTCELQRLHDKITETERKAKEKEERIRNRECQRLESKRRMAKWNYTVESLLEKKKDEAEAQEKAERESFEKLLKEIKAGKDQASADQLARATKLSLYRNGLIQDFHSALAFSKMMQDIERSHQKSEADKDDETLPICETTCMKKMLAESDKVSDFKKEEKPKKVNEKLKTILVNIENRQKDQECEVNKELSSIKKMLKDNLPALPEKYLKQQNVTCKEVSLQDKFVKRREQFHEELDEKLATDAYIESHEKEVERQACEYTKFFHHKNYIRKQTEERLIKEKVQQNIEKSEKAGAVLVAMRNKKKKESAYDYDALKEKWEEEIQDKEEEKQAQREALMQKVTKDFLERKGVERCKWQMRDVSRLWARERLVAVENYEQECDRKNLRRQREEEVQLYNQALATEQKCRLIREKNLDNAWAEKVKSQYFDEMQKMKDYAHECIRDWTGKGRSSIPMHHAMKKWEYDSQMDPRMFREHERKLAEKNKECGAGDAKGNNNFAELMQCPGSMDLVKNAGKFDETTQSTSKRLGFC